jgi:hypothetical protein
VRFDCLYYPLSGWPILSALMFVVAILIAMFPSQLPSQAVKEMAASIVHLARGVTILEPVDSKLSRTGVLFQSYYVLALQTHRLFRLLFCFILFTDHYFCFFSSSFCILYPCFLFLPYLSCSSWCFLFFYLSSCFFTSHSLSFLCLCFPFIVFLFFVFCFLLFIWSYYISVHSRRVSLSFLLFSWHIISSFLSLLLFLPSCLPYFKFSLFFFVILFSLRLAVFCSCTILVLVHSPPSNNAVPLFHFQRALF